MISQRPPEVNRTVLSQSNNFIAMRLTNVDDQAVVKRLLPDSLGDYADMLPILDIGEALNLFLSCIDALYTLGKIKLCNESGMIEYVKAN